MRAPRSRRRLRRNPGAVAAPFRRPRCSHSVVPRRGWAPHVGHRRHRLGETIVMSRTPTPARRSHQRGARRAPARADIELLAVLRRVVSTAATTSGGWRCRYGAENHQNWGYSRAARLAIVGRLSQEASAPGGALRCGRRLRNAPLRSCVAMQPTYRPSSPETAHVRARGLGCARRSTRRRDVIGRRAAPAVPVVPACAYSERSRRRWDS